MDENAPISGGDAVATEAAPALPAFPETADGYDIRLPGDFAFPEGYELGKDESPINGEDPRVADARAFAHANKMTQEQFERMVEMGVKADFAEQTRFREALAQQVELLGPKAQERVSAVKNWVTAKLPEHQARAILGTLFTRDQVEGFETLMRLNRGNIPGNPGAARDSVKPELSDEEYDRMSVAERLTYAREHSRR